MNTIKLKGKTNHDYGLQILDWEAPILPDLNDEYKAIAGKDGLRHTHKYMSNKPLRIHFFRKNKNIEEWNQAKKNIIEWLFTRNEVEIERDDEPDVYFVGKLAEAEIPQKYKTAVDFWVEFNLQPIKYGETKVINDTTFTYHGTYDMTPFKMTLENVTANELVVSVNGVEIKYTEPLEDETVTIDSNELELRVDGKLKVFEVEGYFSFLKPGEIKIDINTEADLTIEYTEMFL